MKNGTESQASRTTLGPLKIQLLKQFTLVLPEQIPETLFQDMDANQVLTWNPSTLPSTKNKLKSTTMTRDGINGLEVDTDHSTSKSLNKEPILSELEEEHPDQDTQEKCHSLLSDSLLTKLWSSDDQKMKT